MVVVSDRYSGAALQKAVKGRGKIPADQDLDFLNYFTVGEYIAHKYARPGRRLKHVQYDVEYSDQGSDVDYYWIETTRQWRARQLSRLKALAVSHTHHVQIRLYVGLLPFQQLSAKILSVLYERFHVPPEAHHR